MNIAIFQTFCTAVATEETCKRVVAAAYYAVLMHAMVFFAKGFLGWCEWGVIAGGDAGEEVDKASGEGSEELHGGEYDEEDVV